MKTREMKKEMEKQVTLKMMMMIGGMVIAGSTVYQNASYAQVDKSVKASVNQTNIEGTGVGNGTGGARDQYLASLENQLGTQIEMSNGSNMDAMIDWCGRATIALKRGAARAMLQVRSNNKIQAEQTLVDTLVKVGQSLTVDPMIGGPMTKKLVDRTLKYSQRLDQDLPNGGIALTTKVNFLFNAVNFIIGVEKELDTPYYIPFRYRHNGRYPGAGCSECSTMFDYSAFEMRFIKVAAQQLSFVVKSLTETSVRNGSVQVYPLGDPKAFLAIAEMVSGNVARDLRENLHAYVNCAAIRDLEYLQATLIDYNISQDRSIFPNSRWAVNAVEDALLGIKSKIKTYANSCGYVDTNFEFNYQSDYAVGGDHE